MKVNLLTMLRYLGLAEQLLNLVLEAQAKKGGQLVVVVQSASDAVPADAISQAITVS